MATKHEPRRAKPNERFTFADASGALHSFSADEDGVVHPKSDAEVAACDRRGLPVARKAQAAEKAEKES